MRKGETRVRVTEEAKVRRRCPLCGRPAVPRYRPFCSARCAEIDLGRWLSGAYRIPSREEPEEDTPPSAAEDEE